MANVIIIGGGLSGLSSGIYALKSGYDVTIIEKNKLTGGLCTTWERDGAIIDGCIHWVTGCSKGNMVPIYQDLGLFDNCKIIHPRNFYKYKYKDCVIEISRKLNQFQDNLLKYAETPDDISRIKQFIKLVKKYRNMPYHSGRPIDVMTPAQFANYIKDLFPYAMSWQKMANISLKDFADGFTSEVLKHFFVSFMPSYYCITYFVGVIAAFVNGNADTVNITSKAFADQARKKYEQMGGKIIYNTTISKLNIENGKITSIEDSTGKKYYADYFINSTPIKYFYDNLLPVEYHQESVDFVFSNDDSYPLISTVYVAMTVDKELAKDIDFFELIYDEEGITVGSYHNETLHYRAYPYFENKTNTTTVISLIDINAKDYNIFTEAKEKGTYEKLKNDLANQAMNIYLKKHPEYKDSIKIVDVATPITFSKYTNTYKGAYLSNLMTPFGARKTFKFYDGKLSNLFYGGQWITEIGGLPCSLANGKFAVDEINYMREKELKIIKKEKLLREKLAKKSKKAREK